MAHQLRRLAFLLEDPGLTSSTTRWSQSSVTLVPGEPTPSSGLWTPGTHMVHVYTCRQNTQTPKIKSKNTRIQRSGVNVGPSFFVFSLLQIQLVPPGQIQIQGGQAVQVQGQQGQTQQIIIQQPQTAVTAGQTQVSPPAPLASAQLMWKDPTVSHLVHIQCDYDKRHGSLASVKYVIVFYRHNNRLLSRDSKWPRLLKGRPLSTSQLMQMAQFSSKVNSAIAVALFGHEF